MDIKPIWWNSIRAIIALILTVSYCYAIIFCKEITADKISGLKELSLMALTFYFILKKRPEEIGGTNGKV